MTDDDRATLKRQQDQQRKREDELLLLLVLLIDDGARQADAIATIKQSLTVQGIPQIAKSMALAHLDAFRLHASEAATAYAKQHEDSIIRTYTPAATVTANAMADSIAEKLRGVSPENIHAALSDAGYTVGKPASLKLGIVRNIVPASNAGLVMGAAVMNTVYGLTHVSVLDLKTTKICTERAGLTLPIDDPYFEDNWPSLHANCRSSLWPIYNPKTAWSTTYPELAPDAGYGDAPPGLLESLRALKATAAA